MYAINVLYSMLIYGHQVPQWSCGITHHHQYLCNAACVK